MTGRIRLSGPNLLHGIPGDDGQALLFVLQRIDSPGPGTIDREAAFGTVSNLIEKMSELDSEQYARSIVRGTRIANLSPLSIAISLADTKLLKDMLAPVPDSMRTEVMKIQLGGDLFSPIYFCINHYFITRKLKDDFPWLLRSANVNPLRMTAPSAYVTRFRENIRNPEATDPTSLGALRQAIQISGVPDFPLDTCIEILKLLNCYGADPNQLQRNGRYPLDLALEIGNAELTAAVKAIGGYRCSFWS